MAEPRRVQLTTVTFSAVRTEPAGHVPEAPRHSPERGEKRPKEAAETVRLTLRLFEPDDRNFPEFCYSQLVEDKERVQKPQENGAPLSRFEEEEKRENDELAQIARKLEQKYGSKPKKKKDRVQDLIDMGFGYDDEDSFIDNSEAYDEFVPSSITTKFGGFYINSGVLQFRDVSDAESNAAPAEEGTHKKKRKLNGQMRPKNKRCKSEETDEVPRSEASAEIRPGNGMKKKKKKMASTLSVTNMLKRFQREKEHEHQRLERASGAGGTPMPLGPADAAGGGDPILSLLGSTNDQELIKAATTVDFDIDLDTLLDVTEGISSPGSQLGSDKTEDQNRASASSELQAQPAAEDHLPEGSSEETQVHQETLAPKDLPLPEGLPPELEHSVRKLLTAAKTSEGASKLKFFTPEINSVLLDVEFQCRQNAPLCSRVYAHLSSYLPCSRETLLQRVRKLLHKHSEERSDAMDPVQRLKEAIARSMPDQIASFKESCQAFEQAKVLKEMEDKDDHVEQKAVKRSGPRKLFKWNEEIRECLRGVIRAKMGSFKSGSAGSHEAEEALKVLIENDVKPLWPKGWMQSRALMRESRKASELFASCQFEKKQSSMSDASLLDSCVVRQGSPPPSLPQDSSSVCLKDPAVSAATSQPAPVASLSALQRLGSGSASEPDASADRTDAVDLLEREGLARGHCLLPTQEDLMAALTKYKLAAQPFKFGADLQSRPVPPPPQSSPIDLPECRSPPVMPPRHFSRAGNGGEISDVVIID